MCGRRWTGFDLDIYRADAVLKLIFAVVLFILSVMVLCYVAFGAGEKEEDVEVLSVGFSNREPVQSNVPLAVTGSRDAKWYVSVFVVNGEEQRAQVAVAIQIEPSEGADHQIFSMLIVKPESVGCLWFDVSKFIQKSRKGIFTARAKVEYPVESGHMTEVKSKLYVY